MAGSQQERQLDELSKVGQPRGREFWERIHMMD